jgi:protein O-GlcNAc transferase
MTDAPAAAPGRSPRWAANPTILAAAVALLLLLVMALGAAVLVVKLREPAVPSSTVAATVQAWQDGVVREPDSAVAHTGLGLALLRAGRPAAAQDAFERAVVLDPDDWMASFQLGLLLVEGDPDRAGSLLARAGEKAPAKSKAAPYVALGDLRLAEEDFAAARGALEAAVADGPMLVEARLGLAAALEALGDLPGARDQYQEARRYDPGNRAAAEGLGRLDGATP